MIKNPHSLSAILPYLLAKKCVVPEIRGEIKALHNTAKQASHRIQIKDL